MRVRYVILALEAAVLIGAFVLVGVAAGWIYGLAGLGLLGPLLTDVVVRRCVRRETV